MSETPAKLALWALGLVAVALLGMRYLGRGTARRLRGARDPGRRGRRRRVARDGPCRAGAVRRPGVYRLAARSRVVDAVRRAGGARRRADLERAEPRREARGRAPGRRAAAATGGRPGARGRRDGARPAPVDLNTATAEQLDQLDGIGPGMAGRILEYRKEHGGFGSVEELGQVPGIGEKRMAALREKVRV